MLKLTHWVNPRETIAGNYKDNDYGYVFHATSLFVNILAFANLTIDECKNRKVLDYGCGTGRVARVFALTGAEVYGYDPVVECILESQEEYKKVDTIKQIPKLLTANLSEIPDNFDLIYCVNVLEHLNEHVFNIAISNIENRLANNGQCLLWVHTSKNSQFLAKHHILPDFTKVKKLIGVQGIKTNGIVRYSAIYRNN